MNASDIKDFVFNKSAVGGYKISDVRGCLKEISEYVLGLEEKNYNLDRENKSLKSKLSELEKTQDEIKEIMVSAQGFRHEILKKAEEKTNELIAKAKEKAKKIEEEAEQCSSKKMDEFSKKIEAKELQLEKLKTEVSDFKAKLFEIYKSHLDLISKMPENDNNVAKKTNDKNKNITQPNEFSFYENKSEAAAKLQNEQKTDLNGTSSNFSDFSRNLSENENIFQKKLIENSNQNYSNKIKNPDNYIKSRFDELNI